MGVRGVLPLVKNRGVKETTEVRGATIYIKKMETKTILKRKKNSLLCQSGSTYEGNYKKKGEG